MLPISETSIGQQAEILYLSDRMRSDDPRIPFEMAEILKRQGLVNPDSGKIHFCGFLAETGKVAVFLPRNSYGSKEPASRAAHYLIRALTKFYRVRKTGIRADDHGVSVMGGEALSLVVALLEDYMSNGLYVRRTRVRTTNDGKTNWPRTIARSTAYPSASGPLYLDLSTTRTFYSSDCMTARIHAAVIREFMEGFGMLWLGKSGPSSKQIATTPAPAGHRASWIVHLRKELQLSYSERDIFLIGSLTSYLERRKGTATGPLLIGVHKFHALWEAMLDSCLVGKISVNERLPVPAYLGGNGKVEMVAGKGQRTDTVLESSDAQRIAIIDAKYYGATSPQTAPGWPDLVKQFFYQKFVSNIYPDRLISNHFVFPGVDGKNLKAAFVAERGKKIESVSDRLSDYSPIHCHYQDPLELLRFYVTGEKLKKLTEEIFMVS